MKNKVYLRAVEWTSFHHKPKKLISMFYFYKVQSYNELSFFKKIKKLAFIFFKKNNSFIEIITIEKVLRSNTKDLLHVDKHTFAVMKIIITINLKSY